MSSPSLFGSENPRVLIVGAGGQLGRELIRTAPDGVEITARSRAELDISDAAAVSAVMGEISPAAIINAAAYTAVDKAESEPDAAYAVNRDDAANLAKASRETGCRLVQISTDFVFDGNRSSPYRPTDTANPLGVYGASKLAGEQAVQDILGDQALIVRTAWVYSRQGGNFVNTMLRLMGERESVRVVSDQVGTPTWARGLAEAIWRAVGLGLRGIHHWTDAGVASWYDFAVAIQEEALAVGLLERSIDIHPIRAVDYPTPAMRPPYSVLDKSETWKALGYEAEHWRVALRKMLGAAVRREG
jgi:dTDP-4-dehydrorhamnose reductase